MRQQLLSFKCQSHLEPVLYLKAVIKPLYRFICDQSYEVVDGKFVWRERDHEDIIVYDDVNQLFWYPNGIASEWQGQSASSSIGPKVIIFISDTSHGSTPSQRFMRFDCADWNRAFFKTYYEKRSISHLIVDFNRIWITQFMDSLPRWPT